MQLERVGELTKGQLAIKPALTQFNGGEISPQLEGRFDWDKYAYSAKVCKNFIPQVEGGLKRRGGSHFVSLSRQPKEVGFYIKVNFSDNTSVPPDVTIDMGENGKIEYKNTGYFPIPELSLPSSAPEGTLVEYTVYAEGYGVGYGSFVAEQNYVSEVHLTKIEDGATLTVETSPVGGVVYINGVKKDSLLVPKNTDIDVIVNFGETNSYYKANISEDTTVEVSVPIVMFESNKPQKTYMTFDDALYDVVIVGGGAGASGGAYGNDHKTCGGGGGSGACFVGTVRLFGRTLIEVGSGGAGGECTKKVGKFGGRGGASRIGVRYKSNENTQYYIVTAGGGYTGDQGYYDVGTLGQGAGGKLTIWLEDLIESTETASDGNGGKKNCAEGAESLYRQYGRGGDGRWKKDGTSGADGYVKVVYKGRYK